MKQFFVLCALLVASVAQADVGQLYTCTWDHSPLGEFTVLEGTDNTAEPFYILRSDHTGYWIAESEAAEAKVNLSWEIRATLLPAAPTFIMQVTTFNDSSDSATCYRIDPTPQN